MRNRESISIFPRERAALGYVVESWSNNIEVLLYYSILFGIMFGTC